MFNSPGKSNFFQTFGTVPINDYNINFLFGQNFRPTNLYLYFLVFTRDLFQTIINLVKLWFMIIKVFKTFITLLTPSLKPFFIALLFIYDTILLCWSCFTDQMIIAHCRPQIIEFIMSHCILYLCICFGYHLARTQFLVFFLLFFF